MQATLKLHRTPSQDDFAKSMKSRGFTGVHRPRVLKAKPRGLRESPMDYAAADGGHGQAVNSPRRPAPSLSTTASHNPARVAHSHRYNPAGPWLYPLPTGPAAANWLASGNPGSKTKGCSSIPNLRQRGEI